METKIHFKNFLALPVYDAGVEAKRPYRRWSEMLGVSITDPASPTATLKSATKTHSKTFV